MRLKLVAQFSLVTSVVLIFTSAVFFHFNIATLQKTFLETYVHEVDSLSEVILRATRQEMLSNNREAVFQVIDEVRDHSKIEHIRLINKDGLVVYSTNATEIDTQINKIDERACRTCHRGEKPLTHAGSMDRSNIFNNSDGMKILGISKPIYNEESCSSGSCHVHSSDLNLLGILDVAVSMDAMILRVNNYRNNFLIQVLFLISSLILCLIMLTRKLITQPVKTLLDHTRAVAKGDWKYVDSVPGDELGELGEAFNEMTRKLKIAREERDEWAATLETRVEVRTRKIQEMQSVLIRSEKLASLGELVAGIAHELNNPLTGIMIHAPMIAEDPRLDPTLREDCKTIIEEAKRCSKIVGELLDFSRVSDIQKTMSSINETIDRALALIEHHADFHDIDIIKKYETDIPDLFMDSSQIEQVVVNMLVNASQAMPEGGSITITTKWRPSDSTIVVQMTDTGVGIPADNLEKLFDPLFTKKGHKGTGLGLSVSYGIIESHGGEIHVLSKVGEGTTFIIELPLTLPEDGETGEDSDQ
ncbi:HAMP domain-containing protein [bacterium]|nr:MAG: HAMP domain-containing protein [bacterium]